MINKIRKCGYLRNKWRMNEAMDIIRLTILPETRKD